MSHKANGAFGLGQSSTKGRIPLDWTQPITKSCYLHESRKGCIEINKNILLSSRSRRRRRRDGRSRSRRHRSAVAVVVIAAAAVVVMVVMVMSMTMAVAVAVAVAVVVLAGVVAASAGVQP